MKYLPFLTVLFSATLNFGCATVASIKQEPINKGPSFVVKADFKKTFEAAKEAVQICGLEVEEANINDEFWMVIAEKGVIAFSYGERIRIVGEPVSAKETHVRIVTKAKLATNVFADAEKHRSCILQSIRLDVRD